MESIDKELMDMNNIINDHWNYIRGVLQATQKQDADIREIEFHYKTAFRHGWKHALEYRGVDK